MQRPKKEFKYITGSDVSQTQKSRLAYLTQTWSALPNFYEEGGRGFSGFAANLGVALLDPLNIISGGIGGIVGKAAVGTAAKQVLKSATKTAAGKNISLPPLACPDPSNENAISNIG